MRLLVTGGAGFLGSHLSRRLIKEGHDLVILDNLHTGSLNNIADLLEYANVEFVEQDVTAPLKIEIDGIFNLACPASPIQYQLDPVRTMKTNVIGAANILDLAQSNKCKVFQASTSEIYGDPIISPQSESYWGNVNPVGIRACYDEGKRAAETLFFDFHRQLGLDIRVARIFNTYGPYMSPYDGRVVSNFIVQALEGADLTLYGDGGHTRSFCYVDDLIEGILRLFFSELEISLPVNLGNPEPISMLTLAKEIIELTKSTSKIVFLPLPEDDPKTREPDITKARNLLGWEPQVSRKEGLMKTVDYFKAVTDNR